MPTTVLLLRHGQSTWNASRRWQGQADPPLSEIGQEQARLAATKLGQFDAVIASDLERARHTAEIIAANLGIGPVEIDPRLRENDAGEWTGMTHEEIAVDYPGWVDAGRRPPGFEPFDSIVARGLESLLLIGRQYPDSSVLGVSHGGTLRCLRGALGASQDDGFPNLAGQWFTVYERDVQLSGGVIKLIENGELGPASQAFRDRADRDRV